MQGKHCQLSCVHSPASPFLALTLLHQCTERSSEFSENTQHINNMGEVRLKEGADK